MGVDTEELKVSSNYTISEYVSCHRTVTFAGNGNFYEKTEAKAQRGCLHEITVSRFCQVIMTQKMPTPAKAASFFILDTCVKLVHENTTTIEPPGHRRVQSHLPRGIRPRSEERRGPGNRHPSSSLFRDSR